MSENFIPLYDLESLTETQRQEYIKAVCKHMGVPDNLNLVSLTYVDDAEGPSRLVPYAKRGATENVRNALQIDIQSLTNQMIGGSIVFTATAKSKTNGRQEIATGSKSIDGLQGTPLDDAIMTASTRALRRVTLQFIGAGVLDESEVNQRKTVHVTTAPAVAVPQPTVKPSAEPGKDVTLTPLQEFQKQPDHDTQKCVESNVPCGNIVHDIGKFTVVDISPDTAPKTWKSQEEFEAAQAKMRADAIAQLNAKAKESEPTPEVKKTRKPRGPNKKKVDLGPSEPVPQYAEPTSNPSPRQVEHAIDMAKIAAQPNVAAAVIAPLPAPDVVTALKTTEPLAVPVKPKLSTDQVKPFRQRLFRVVNDYLEPHGFAPKEGMGNADKMRAFAVIMFPEVTNMNQLDEIQWEKYLSTLENKIKEIGPAETIKYIDGSIGI